MSAPVTHEAIMDRLEAGNNRFAALEEGHSLILTQQAAMLSQQAVILEKLEPLPQMRADLTANTEVTTEVREIVSAWTTAKNIGRFAKWVAAPAALLWAVLAWGQALATGLARTIGGH